jgi:O-antigen/teichoic acid export membrane protein
MAGSRVLVLASGVVIAPILVSQLGAAAFGAWAVVLAAAGLFAVFGSGSEQVVARVIAAMRARGTDTRRPIAIAVSLAAAEACLLTLALVLVAPLIIDGTGISGSLESDAVEAMRWVAVSYVFQRAARAATGCLSGLGRHRARALTEILTPILFALAGIAALLAGGGLVALSLTFLLANVAGAIVSVAALRGAPGGEEVDGHATALTLLRLGRPRQISQVAFVIALLAERLLVSQFAGEIAVARFAAASTLVTAATMVILYALNPLGPELAGRAASEGKASVRSALHEAERSTALLAGACLGALAACGVPLMAAWLGPELEGGRYIAVLVPGFFLWLIARAGFHGAAALDEPWLEARAAVIAGVINVGLALVLLAAFGADAAGIATAVSLAAWAAAFAYSSRGVLGAPALGELLIPGLLAAAIAAPLAIGGRLLLAPDAGSRWTQLGMAVVLAVAFLGLYAVAVGRSARLLRARSS